MKRVLLVFIVLVVSMCGEAENSLSVYEDGLQGVWENGETFGKGMRMKRWEFTNNDFYMNEVEYDTNFNEELTQFSSGTYVVDEDSLYLTIISSYYAFFDGRIKEQAAGEGVFARVSYSLDQNLLYIGGEGFGRSTSSVIRSLD